MAKEKFELSDHYGTFIRNGSVLSIRFERLLSYPVKNVWDAITKPETLALWLSSNVDDPKTEIDLRLGGKVRLQYMMPLPEGKITGLETEKLLEITWNGESKTRWELFDEGDHRCRIIFTEPIDEFGAVAYHAYLDFLSLVLDGKQVPSGILEEWDSISGEPLEKYRTLLKELNSK